MARDPQERSDLAELIRRIEGTRNDLEGHVHKLRRTLDVPSRVRQSILHRPMTWFGGSMGAGLLASRLFRRRPKRKERKSKGFFGLILATVLALLKPALKNLVVNELQRRFIPPSQGGNREKETQLSLSKDQPAAANS